MLRLPREYAQVLRDLRDTSDNPFYWLERRRENRSGEPWKGIWNAIFLLTIVFTITLGGIWLAMREGVASDIFVNGRIPKWLGGGDGGRSAFAFIAATHSLLVYYAARNLANRVLTSEARRGSLFQLLLARLPAFEMVLEMVVYPFQHAMLIALAGLPLYAILISFGSVGIQEVAVLYLLFAVMALAVPNWRTPAFGEQSPEEVGQLLRDQERAAGCAVSAITFVLLPGSIMMGFALWGMHVVSPNAFARIPEDVWPALPAFPLTFAWIIVRVLTAPYTWFGLPLPLWVLIIPVLFLYRLASLWQVSLYLRVAHTTQILALPDVAALSRFRAGIRQILLIGFVGYMWQPLLETGFTGALVWPNALNTDSENLSAYYYLVAVAAFFFAMERAKKLGSTSRTAWRAAGKGPLWVLTPFMPFAVSLLFGAIGMPAAFFSLKTGTILLHLLPSMAAMLFFGASLGQGKGAEWQAIYLLPPFLPFIPIAAIAALSGLSPLSVPLVSNPALAAWMSQNGSWYHLPPWWVTLALPLAAGVLCQWLSSRGALVRIAADDSRPAMQVKLGANPAGTRMPPPPIVAANEAAVSMRVPARPSSAPIALDFVIEGEVALETAAPSSVKAVAPEREITVPIPSPPVVASPHAGYGPPRPATGTPAWVAPPPQEFPHAVFQPVTMSGQPVHNGPLPNSFGQMASQKQAGSEWRWRPLSPMAAAVLRWLSRRTDNPVALYSARRALPGTLNTDQITVALLALGLILLVAYLMPMVLLFLVIPGPVASFIFPPEALRAATASPPMTAVSPNDQVAVGMGLVIAFLVGVTLLSPWGVCKTVADGFRMERERSTLGFLLMTPLSSRGVAVGHCVGALLPALTLWTGAALCGVIPMAFLAGLYEPFPAVWAWGYGFFLSFMYLVMCTVVGMWIGITEVKARDMTIGVYLLPFSFCVIAAGCSFYTYRYWEWNYFQYHGLFVAICIGLIVWMWRNAMKELYRMRRGDVPFEGRTVSN